MFISNPLFHSFTISLLLFLLLLLYEIIFILIQANPTLAANGSHKQLISVDATSYENHKHTGLYAMGPLVGENYVRFLGGGAFAISSHIIKNVKTLT